MSCEIEWTMKVHSDDDIQKKILDFLNENFNGGFDPSDDEIVGDGESVTTLGGGYYMDPEVNGYQHLAVEVPDAHWSVDYHVMDESGGPGSDSFMKAEYKDGVLKFCKKCFVDDMEEYEDMDEDEFDVDVLIDADEQPWEVQEIKLYDPIAGVRIEPPVINKYTEDNGTDWDEEQADIAGLVFVVTGKLHKFDNRDSLIEYIEEHDGQVSRSISGKTDYLINNDPNSTSQKNQKAKALDIPIISEDEFIQKFCDPEDFEDGEN